MAQRVAEMPIVGGEWIEAYFEEFERWAIKSDAARYAGVDPSTVRTWRRGHPEFAEREAEAKAIVLDRVRKALMQRSIEGTVEPIYHDGKLVGAKTVHDNKLLMFVAERLMREEFHLSNKLEVENQTTLRFEFPLGERDDIKEIEEGDVAEIEDAEFRELPAGE